MESSRVDAESAETGRMVAEAGGGCHQSVVRESPLPEPVAFRNQKRRLGRPFPGRVGHACRKSCHSFGFLAVACSRRRYVRAGRDRPAEHEQVEAYEHLGVVKTCVLNLHPRYQELAEARRVFVAPDEALLKITRDYAFPPSVVWEWLND